MHSLIGILRTVCILLMQGADRILTDRSDSPTASQEFLTAVATGDVETLRRCLDGGASVCGSFDFYETHFSPLLLACAFGKLDSVTLLLNARADVDQQSQLGESALFIAAKNGHLQVVDLLIRVQADVNCRSHTGDSPLFVAAQNGHQKVVHLLIKAQADVNIQNDTGESPINVAVRNGHNKVIDRLIKAQADVNIQAINDGCSPLHIASQMGNLQLVKSLVEAKANANVQTHTGNTALHTAIDNAHHIVVRALIEAYPDVNIKDRRHGSAPLHVAVLHGNQSAMAELVAAHADVDAQRNSGATSLYIASQNGHQQVVDSLIRAQADVNLQRLTGESPLYAASFYGHKPVVGLLIAAGADANLQESADGSSPLYIALQNGHDELVDSLIKAQADVNLRTKFGSSPLYMAAQNFQPKAVDLLIGAQANVDVWTVAGDRPLHTASQSGHKQVVDALIKAQADVNVTTDNGETPIHCASYNGHVQVVDSLIKSNARLNPQKYSGETPMHAAALNRHPEVVKLLIRERADVNLQRVGGESTLYIAADCGNNQIVVSLINAQANVDLQRITGESPINIASQNGHPQVVESLIKAQADVNLQKDDDCPPIFIASQNGHGEVVDLLIKAQADVNLQTNAGEAALHIASQNGHRHVVELLIRAQANVDILTNSGNSPFYYAIHSAHQEIVDLLTTAEAKIDLLIDEKFTIFQIPPLVERRFLENSTLSNRDSLAPSSDESDAEFGLTSDIKEFVMNFFLTAQSSCSSFDEIDMTSAEISVPRSDSELSLQLHSALAQSGFLDSRSALQTSVADVLQEIQRKRLNNDGIFVVGSYSEGWGNSLKTVDGRTDIESDIDMMRLIAGKLYHPVGVCQCGDAVVKQVFSNGHIMCPGYASNPSEASFGSNLRPAVDHVVASRLCRYPPIAPLQPDRVSNSNISKSVLQSLQQHLTASQSSPCHVVHAASPGRGGQELRVSTSFLEKRLLRSLNTVQGQLFVTLKYLVKKVIAHKSGFDVQGVKPYHVKTITFRMLEKKTPDEWRPENLVSLTRESLQMLIDSVESSCTLHNVHGRVMDHFFLNDAALYLKGVSEKGSSMEATLKNIVITLRTVKDQLPMLLMQFQNSLKPLSESGRFYFHPFLILPIVTSNPVTETNCSLDYYEIPDVVGECLLRLSHGDCCVESKYSLTELIDRLPDCARSAREALRALVCLKFGDRDAAARLVSDCRGHEVSRGIDWSAEMSATAATMETVWPNLRTRDSAWKFCLWFKQRPELRFLTGALTECFPLQMRLNSITMFYMNFDALLWTLRFELQTESEDFGLEWIEDVAQREDADEQELLLAGKYCSEHKMKQELREKLSQLQLRQVVQQS